MEEKVFIFGVTDLAENLFYHLMDDGVKIEGFVVNRNYKQNDIFLGYSVYEYENLDEVFPDIEISFYVCIGYSHMNCYRKQLFEEIKKKNYHIKSYIHKTANIFTQDIGEGNLIFECAYVGMYSHIGDGNIFYPKSMVAHHAYVGDFNFFSISCSVAGKVVIGNENFFGNNSTTKDRIEIGNKVLIGAGAYVDKNLTDNKVIVPQKSIVLENKNSYDLI